MQVQVAIANTNAWATAHNLVLAVPEPATWALWLVGLAGCSGVAVQWRATALRAQ